MSQRPKRDKSGSESFEDLEISTSGLPLKISKNLATVLDAYRINRAYSTQFVDEAINEGELPRSFIQQWGTIRSVLHKLAALGPKIPNVEKWLNQKQYISFASMALLTITVPLLLATWFLSLAWLQPYVIPMSVAAVALLLISWLSSGWFNRKVAWAIHNHIEDHPELVRRERKVLKKWAQSMIYHVARLLRKSDEDPDKNLLKLFNSDYEGIEILKEPGGFRKHYVARLKV
jgi:hypothetical protein